VGREPGVGHRPSVAPFPTRIRRGLRLDVHSVHR
jgi:hypothetical protein